MQRDFTFLDFVGQATEIARHFRLAPALARRLGIAEFDLEAEARRLCVVSASMTSWERDHADALDASRRRRIAAGAGVSVIRVSEVLWQFEMSRQMMDRA